MNKPILYQQIIQLHRQQDMIECQLGLCTSNLEELKYHAYNFLHSDEIEYFKSLEYEKRQLSYLLGRYCAKNVVGLFNKITNLNTFQIKSGVFKQPFLSGFGVKEAQISLTHCEEMTAAIAFPSALLVGIDIEYIQEKFADSLLTQMNKQELYLIQTHFPAEQLSLALTLFWTAKEALSKALKTGLTIELNLLSINSIECQQNYWLSNFSHFPQYQAISFHSSHLALSIVFPKQYQIELNIDAIKEWIGVCDPGYSRQNNNVTAQDY